MGKIRFDEIAKECRGSYKGDLTDMPIVGLEHIEPKDMLLSRYDVNVETTFSKPFKKGQILFGRRRAYQQKACVATFDGICSGDITLIEPKGNLIYPDLLPFVVQNDNFFEHAIKGSNGALSPRVKWEHMANYELNLPPLEEQKILAEKLWAAYRVKQSYIKMIEATDEMVKSQFIEMFGDSYTNAKTTLSDYMSLKAGKSKKAELIQDSQETAHYPCYGGNGIRGYVDDFTHNGTYCIIGRQGAQCGNVQLAHGEFYATEHAVVVSPLIEIDNTWLFYALTRMNLNQYARGVAQPGLAVNQLEKLSFSLPTIEEQNRFASIADQADKSKFEIQQSIDAVDKVIKSLINENL